MFMWVLDPKGDIGDVWAGLDRGVVKLRRSPNAYQSGQHHFGANKDRRLRKIYMGIVFRHPWKRNYQS